MLQLKVYQLQDFLKQTSSITENLVSPLLAYIKLTPDGRLIKNNLQTFCSMKIDVYDQKNELQKDILVHEETLTALLNKTKAELIDLYIENGNVYIDDGLQKVSHQFEEPDLYPEMPVVPSERTLRFDSMIIDAISVARAFMSTNENTGQYRAVHLNGSLVAGFDIHVRFIKELKGMEFPKIVLSSSNVDAILQFAELDFFNTERHYFIKPHERILFGFTKTDIKPFDAMPVLNIIKGVKEPVFKILKNDIVEFCDIANAISKTKLPVASMNNEPPSLTLKGDIYNKGITRRLTVEGVVPEFYFNPRITINAFKAIKQDNFCCQYSQFVLIINDNEGGYACFSGLQPAQQTETQTKTKTK